MALNILAIATIMFTLARAAQFKASTSPRDDDRVCSDSNRLSFGKTHLFYSNLRGFGPHMGQPQGMLIRDVFSPQSGNFKDLLVTTLRRYYPFQVSSNTITGDVVSISMDAGSEVDLQLTFLDRVSRKKTEPGLYALTFMNFEELNVRGCNRYELSDNTLVEAIETGDNSVTFRSGASKVAPTRAFALTDAEKAGAVVVRCNQPTLVVEARMWQGPDGDNLYFTGPSNVVCPTRQTCSDFECPRFFSPFATNAETYCKSEECTWNDLHTCCYEQVPERCEMKNVLVFPPDSLMYSNLGGHGPNTSVPEGIRYKNVFPKSGEVVDLVINSLSEYDTTTAEGHQDIPKICDKNNNGVIGEFGRVAVSSGAEVKLRASFKKHATDTPVSIPDGFFFTIYNFDEEQDRKGRETVKISGYDFYAVTPNSSISVEHQGGIFRQGIFTSTQPGSEEDSPAFQNFRKLPQDALDKSVTFGFPNDTSEWTMTFQVGDGSAARNFDFTGYSVLPCPQQGQCSSMACPRGYMERRQSDQSLCLGAVCWPQNDLETCCVKSEFVELRASCDSMLCPQSYDLRDDAENFQCGGEVCLSDDTDTCCKAVESFSQSCGKENGLVLSSVAGKWVTDGVLKIEYENVFPYLKRAIDLKVTLSSDSDSTTKMSFANVPDTSGSLRKMQLPGDSTILAEFQFLDPMTGQTIADMPDFFFTLFGGSVGRSPPLRVTFEGDNLREWTVGEDSATPAVQRNSTFVLESLGSGEVARLETLNLFALDEQAKGSGVSLLLNASLFQLRIHKELPEGHTFARTVASIGAGDDSLLFFGGASSLTCKPRATCLSHRCPSGYVLREDAVSLVCNGEMCTADDSPTCCDCDAAAAFLLAPGGVKHAELGDPGAENPALVIANVFPQSGRLIHLRIKAMSAYYPGLPSKDLEAIHGQFLNINIRTSSETKFRFSFVDSDGKPALVPFNWVFAVLDLDQQEDGGAQEEVEVSDFEWYTHSDHVEHDTVNGAPVFRSTGAGAGSDNPMYADHLLDWHLKTSVSFMMKKNLEHFDVRIKVADGFKARNLLFAGQTNLVCSSTDVCSNYACPLGMSHVDYPELVPCHAEVCNAQDEHRCCKGGAVADVPPIGDQPDLSGIKDWGLRAVAEK